MKEFNNFKNNLKNCKYLSTIGQNNNVPVINFPGDHPGRLGWYNVQSQAKVKKCIYPIHPSLTQFVHSDYHLVPVGNQFSRKPQAGDGDD
jgi:hypothetical protein